MRSFNPLFMIIFWVTALYISWNLYQGGVGILSWEFHSRLQAGLQAFVVEHLEKNIPNVTDIQFTSLWSSYVRDNEIKVFFEYEFKHPLEDQMTKSQLKGWAILNPTDQDIQESWEVKEIQINRQSIDYDVETVIVSTVGSIETSNPSDSTDDVILPDREGVKGSKSLPETKSIIPTHPTSTTSELEPVSQNSIDKVSSPTLKKVKTSTSSTQTLPILPPIDLKE